MWIQNKHEKYQQFAKIYVTFKTACNVYNLLQSIFTLRLKQEIFDQKVMMILYKHGTLKGENEVKINFLLIMKQ